MNTNQIKRAYSFLGKPLLNTQGQRQLNQPPISSASLTTSGSSLFCGAGAVFGLVPGIN